MAVTTFSAGTPLGAAIGWSVASALDEFTM